MTTLPSQTGRTAATAALCASSDSSLCGSGERQSMQRPWTAGLGANRSNGSGQAAAQAAGQTAEQAVERTSKLHAISQAMFGNAVASANPIDAPGGRAP